MSLFRKPRSPFWWYTFYFQGKRHRASTGEKTKAAAATVEAAALTKLNEGIAVLSPSARRPTLQAFATRFLEWTETSRQLKPNTRRFYLYGWRLLSFTRLASMPLDHITTELVDCTRFLRPVMNRRTNKPTEHVVECSPTYTNQALRTLQAMLSKAVEWKLLTTYPYITTTPTKNRDRLIDPNSEIALQKAFHAPTKNAHTRRRREQAWLIFLLVFDAGMRPDEVFPMRIENHFYDQNRIWIPEGKTINAARFVSMSDRLKMMLLNWCDGRSGWVFPSTRSACGHVVSIAKSFSSARSRGELDPRIVLYSGRHTYATHTFAATGNLFAVSKSMGHAGIKSMEPYQHQDTGILTEVINQRNRLTANVRESEAQPAGHTFGHTGEAIQ